LFLQDPRIRAARKHEILRADTRLQPIASADRRAPETSFALWLYAIAGSPGLFAEGTYGK
jgi:hypothetical protein